MGKSCDAPEPERKTNGSITHETSVSVGAGWNYTGGPPNLWLSLLLGRSGFRPRSEGFWMGAAT